MIRHSAVIHLITTGEDFSLYFSHLEILKTSLTKIDKLSFAWWIRSSVVPHVHEEVLHNLLVLCSGWHCLWWDCRLYKGFKVGSSAPSSVRNCSLVPSSLTRSSRLTCFLWNLLPSPSLKQGQASERSTQSQNLFPSLQIDPVQFPSPVNTHYFISLHWACVFLHQGKEEKMKFIFLYLLFRCALPSQDHVLVVPAWRKNLISVSYGKAFFH